MKVLIASTAVMASLAFFATSANAQYYQQVYAYPAYVASYGYYLQTPATVTMVAPVSIAPAAPMPAIPVAQVSVAQTVVAAAPAAPVVQTAAVPVTQTALVAAAPVAAAVQPAAVPVTQVPVTPTAVVAAAPVVLFSAF
ncbi:MAG TPA: hypothetical protein VF402_06760 [Asticcacaulis sp.]